MTDAGRTQYALMTGSLHYRFTAVAGLILASVIFTLSMLDQSRRAECISQEEYYHMQFEGILSKTDNAEPAVLTLEDGSTVPFPYHEYYRKQIHPGDFVRKEAENHMLFVTGPDTAFSLIYVPCGQQGPRYADRHTNP